MSDLGSARGRIIIDTSDVRRAQQEVQTASRGINQALNAIGIGAGAFGVQQIARFVLQNEELVTSYNRQSVAARTLAGSQRELNALLATYDKATGGAIDQATQLANVTKLMSVGFADDAAELDKFATAIRGISVAMGTSQDTVTQNLILELFTQRGARLDQLGLQYDKVRQRADALLASDRTLTAETAYQQAVLEQAIERYGGLAKSAEGGATSVEELRASLKDLRLELGKVSSGPLNLLAKGTSNWLKTARGHANELLDILKQIGQSLDFSGRLFPDTQSRGFVPSQAGRHRELAPNAGFTPEQLSAAADHARAVADIERQANADRLDATRQYEEQRTSIIRQYGLTITREAEDFTTSRRRQEEDFNKSIADIRRAGARRELRAAEDLQRDIARAQEDSASRIDDLRKDTNKRLVQIDEDFKRDQERRERDFRDDQLSAAGRLDAIALLELRKDRARQLQDAKKANQEQKSDLKEQLEERIKDEQEALDKRTRQAQEAFDRQLADARQADEERLADMQADQALRQQREDEDRATRLRRMAEDHNLQLAELARQNALRLTQIDEQEALELAKEKEAFGDSLAGLGIFTDAWLARQRRWQAEGLVLLNEYIEAQKRLFMGNVQGPAPKNPYITPGQFPRLGGTPVASTSSRGTSVGTLSIVVNSLPGQSPYDIGLAVREQVILLLEDLAN